MKIAQISCVFRPYKGGIGEVAYYYAKELQRFGHTVDVYTPRYTKELQAKENVDGVQTYRLFPAIKFGNAAVLFSLLWRLHSYDVIHIHYPFFGTAEILWLYKKLFKKKSQKIIFTYHMDVRGVGFLGYYFKWHARFLMPFLLKTADKIIVSSFDYVEHSYAKNLYQNNPQLFIELPFGADPCFKKLDNPAQLDLSVCNISIAEKFILFVGGLDAAHYFKGLEVLLMALPLMKEICKVVIVGKGDNRNYLMQRAQELGVKDKVIFTGFVSDQELVKLYNRANCCVLPSINMNEAFGIVLVQAMACGTPVIASDLPGVRTVVQNNKNGYLVPPRDHKELASRLDFLLQDPQRSHNFGEFGYTLAQKQYNWRVIGAQLDELYKNV